METAQKTAKTVVVVLIINLLSRALALVAGTLITAYYGANAYTSAYSFALSVTNIITTVIGTALTTAVIPIYTENLKDSKKAEGFINSTLSLTVIAGAVIVAAGTLLSPYIAKLSSEGNADYSVFCVRMMFPAVIFISVGFVLSGVLQARGRFYAPAMISLPSSIINIGYIIILSKYFGIKGLVFSTLTGFFVQAVYLVFPMIRDGFKFKISFDYNNNNIKRVFKLAGPAIIGVAAYQINMLTNNSIAYSYDNENFIILSNMQNLGVQIVLTLVLASVSVLYPKLTSCAVNKDFSGFSEIFNTSCNIAALILIPVGIGFHVVGYDIIDTVYGYGKFTQRDVALGASIFSLYAISVLGLGLKEICDRAFYALNDTRTPALNGVFIMAINILLSVFLVKTAGFSGIAVAYSAASLAGGLLIYILINRKIKNTGYKSFLTIILKSVTAGAVMAAAVKLIEYFSGTADTKLLSVIYMAVKICIAVIVYFATLFILKTKELKEMLVSFGLKK